MVGDVDQVAGDLNHESGDLDGVAAGLRGTAGRGDVDQLARDMDHVDGDVDSLVKETTKDITAGEATWGSDGELPDDVHVLPDTFAGAEPELDADVARFVECADCHANSAAAS